MEFPMSLDKPNVGSCMHEFKVNRCGYHVIYIFISKLVLNSNLIQKLAKTAWGR